jgi:phosphoribosylformylglycinamidine synthase
MTREPVGNGQTAARGGAPIEVHRIEVWPGPQQRNPQAEALCRDAAAIGLPVHSARSSHVYLLQGPLSRAQLDTIAGALLADPVTETARIGATPPPPEAQVIEVHSLPGVMDPVAQSVREAVRELTGVEVEVSTGWRYDLRGVDSAGADAVAARLLANPVIHKVHRAPWSPERFPIGQSHEHEVRRVPLVDLDDSGLARLSREAHLFLSLEEMKRIQDYYRRERGRQDPTDIELETLAQTWSEHCVHKTLKSTIVYREERHEGTKARRDEGKIDWNGRPGHTVNLDGSVTIRNLLKSTVVAATHELIREGVDWTLSVFVDNSGVIAFDEEHAVCVKVETHNHPSAIEPYGGAATGIGGCIRDVIGTGLGARPIASTDVFCVAMPMMGEQVRAAGLPEHLGLDELPPGCLDPRRILTQVVAGVRDYGNRMGIPTVTGAVAFDNRYVGNPLVYCGCIGVMARDWVRGQVHRGDLIVALGGRTGRDGIHGATFSSAELEQSSADEFAHAVQIGNAIEEKRLLDAIMRARDEGERPLFHALTDCGAGGFSSAVGEMGKGTGAVVDLDKAPLKYAGLSYTEIWISEAQERMVLAVPSGNLEALRRICREESVELAVLGTFESPPGSAPGDPTLLLRFHGTEVGRLSMRFLHEGIPTPHREAVWRRRHGGTEARRHEGGTLGECLLGLLRHPTIASKHWIVRQYDHEVRGNTVVKPLVGARADGPGDAAVLKPVPGSRQGLAISQGLQTGIGDPEIGGDTYLMALAAVDECVRNLVCVGADPECIAILDNFCWPSCQKPENLGSLVRAAEGCYDAAKAYRTPFVSGKDSLNNQFTIPAGDGRPARTIEVPPTLLITGIGIVREATRCVTMDAKAEGNLLLLVGETAGDMGGSHYQQLYGLPPGASTDVPRTDLSQGPRAARAVAGLIARGLVRAAHDCSDGGLLVAIAEMLIAGATEEMPMGAEVSLEELGNEPAGAAFAETPSRYLLEVREADLGQIRQELAGVPGRVIGRLNRSAVLGVAGHGSVPVGELRQAWLRPLDW